MVPAGWKLRMDRGAMQAWLGVSGTPRRPTHIDVHIHLESALAQLLLTRCSLLWLPVPGATSQTRGSRWQWPPGTARQDSEASGHQDVPALRLREPRGRGLRAQCPPEAAGRSVPNSRVSTTYTFTLPFWNFHKAPGVALKGRFGRRERGLNLAWPQHFSMSLKQRVLRPRESDPGLDILPVTLPRTTKLSSKQPSYGVSCGRASRELGSQTCEGRRGKRRRGLRFLSQPCSWFGLSPGVLAGVAAFIRDQGGGICWALLKALLTLAAFFTATAAISIGAYHFQSYYFTENF
ncbi:uncharacterized protein LOC102891796 [Pteropus alecto]|uniref:uncharacterized protein LOC102891796 n=1 Tax=Pteropus alecto TaxID=9402 RepID=UPI000D534048|nr:uncharacterized protein LOC102891796 [Pteropus alecto]